jgi:four helix bundle protein
MRDYKKLEVWNKAYKLGILIYSVTKTFPRDEIYGLTSQMRRASLSIPLNIAEGSRKSTDKDFRSFLHIAYGSCAELEVQVMYAKDFNYISTEVADSLLESTTQISRMLNAFIKTLS